MGLEVQSGLGEILNNSAMKQFHSHPNLPVKVKVWFQNRRIKNRKSQKNTK